MKILRLRFTNLNSLHGEWLIDFTVPPLSEAGLFAITGPTGAGKTTLLDAITLALYGRAARYGAEPSPEQMMSRHTGVCSAEVEFACASGTYRSGWQLRRARGLAAGKLQAAERRVISLPDETVLTQKIDDSNRKIEELTHLNYDRFLRSVMLAQGDFAAFLKAKPNERTELLEQITGTQIYSEISVAAFRQSQAAQTARDDLKLRHASVPVLAPDARAERENQLAETSSRLGENKDALTKLQIRIAEAKTFLACAEEAADIESEASRIAQARQAATVELHALELHEKAGPFVARLTARALLVQQQENDNARLTALRSQLPALFDLNKSAKTDAEAALASLQRAEDEEVALKPLWAEVAGLDGEISRARDRAGQRAALRQQAEDSSRKLQADRDAKQRLLENQQASLAEISAWLLENSGDTRIAEILPGLQVTAARWKDSSVRLAEIHAEIAKLKRAREENDQKFALSSQAAASLQSDWKNTEKSADQIRDEWEVLADKRAPANWEKDRDIAQLRLSQLAELQTFAADFAADARKHAGLEQEIQALSAAEIALNQTLAIEQTRLQTATELTGVRRKNLDLIRLVQSLEEERHALVAGAACPLCGSTEHPYASPENTPSAELETATAAFENAEQQLAIARQAVAYIEKEQAAHATDKKRTAADLAALSDQLRHREKQWTSKTSALALALAPSQTTELAAVIAAEAQRNVALKQRVTDLRALDEKLRATERAAEKAKDLLNAKIAEKEQFGSALTHQRDNLAQAGARAATQEALIAEGNAKFSQTIAAFALDAPHLNAAEEALNQLGERARKFSKKTADRIALAGEISVTTTSLSEIQKQIGTTSSNLTTLKEEEGTDRQALEKLVAIRRGKFEDRPVAADQDRVSSLIKSQRKVSETAAAHFADSRQKKDTCENQIAELAETTATRGNHIAADTKSLTLDAADTGFATIDHLRAAILPEPRAREIGQMRQRLDQAGQSLAGRHAANAAAQAKLPASARDDAPLLEELASRRLTLESERQALDQSFGALRQELFQDDEHRRSQAEIVAQIADAEREYQRWARLSALIGSATGTVFARFAQGLTLERLVAVANRHLAQLNPRYAMRRSNEAADDLELEIIDQYQGGITRAMRSLSGGESFLTSLALAVGLSELAGGRTIIESLFIDEGFGSLDPATLETAMAALESLQTNGKTIGVISHVDAMKERITTQIRVRKQDGGRSVLEVIA